MRAVTAWIAILARSLLVFCVAYPVVLLWLGIHVRHRERLPLKGPAIIAANHNSHLDVLVLLFLFPLRCVAAVQPAAAADYFFRNAWLKWFALNVVAIGPVLRGGIAVGADPLAACCAALDAGKILLIFPEGTRGDPEQVGRFKSGIWYLASRFPQAPVVPVYMHGLGMAMPKGALIPVPHLVRVAIGHPLHGTLSKPAFMAALQERLAQLRRKALPVPDIDIDLD